MTEMNFIRNLNLKIAALGAVAVIALAAFVVATMNAKPRCVRQRPAGCSAVSTPTPTPTPTRRGSAGSLDEIRAAFDDIGETLRCSPVKTCTQSPLLEPATWALWIALLALLIIAALALWRRFGPAPTDDTDTVMDGGDPFAGYGQAGYDAYQHLMVDGGAPAPYTDTPAPGTPYPPGYLVLGANPSQPQPAPAPADDAVDFDALFGRKEV